jgi:hypothetical protein
MNLNINCGWVDRVLYEVCCSSSKGGLYVTVHSTSPLLLSAILSSVGNWSMWSQTGWTFREAFRITVTCEENSCSLKVLE